ncbi:hypothetical protein [Nostoc sp. FACHB-110]|uniref:hypothetical protein n=1 Tax=Nostoc sp. FACHB-110 TaxID=2692834 RepID=UPI0016824128|nr:hypothetical protein [Nostoc sp. FACHB-110]MBD2441323.1 hypothetical protein [Nostoc sp. FACHB-110]
MLTVWFWEKDSVEYEIFKQYERALVSLGVNFSLEEVQNALEGCTYGLEDALRRTIEYVLWLQKNEKQYFPNAILVSALREQWKPKAWRNEYLELPNLESSGQRWWNAAAKTWGYDVRNRLVADVFYDEGTEFIKFTNGKKITVETAWRWEWERVLEYATNR